MRRTLFTIFSLIIWLLLCAAYPPQTGGEKIEWNSYLNYRFGETLILKGQLQIQEEPQTLTLVFQSDGQTILQPVKVNEQGNFEYEHDFQQTPFRPFSQVEYWLEGILQDGSPFTTSKKNFLYEDNRFPWKTRLQNPFRVHWRQGDLQFAQTALNVAQEAQTSIRKWLPVAFQGTIDIYIYESPGELRQALLISSNSWVGAHADPDLGVILISVSEGLDQRLQMEQQIPHELMHIALYRYQPEAYPNLPVWLQEGLATAVELYPNPDYYALLETAYQNGSLLAMSALCDTFPPQAAQAYLAYAQSASFVDYLVAQHGVEKIRQLIERYGDQYDCEAGFYQNYGATLAQMEKEWQKAQFDESDSSQMLMSLIPWIALILFVLVVPLIYSLRLVSHLATRKE
ncbi:MAG: hypothetical protein Kow0088_01820 [Anaerolineales bacterium]